MLSDLISERFDVMNMLNNIIDDQISPPVSSSLFFIDGLSVTDLDHSEHLWQGKHLPSYSWVSLLLLTWF